MAVKNKASGFYANHHPGGNNWYNNSGYSNGINFHLLNRLADNVTNVSGFGHRMRNNLGFAGRTELARLNPDDSDVESNYFNLPVKVTEQDFLSLNHAQLLGLRQPNGDLPEVTFMHLTDHSELGDRGVEASREKARTWEPSSVEPSALQVRWPGFRPFKMRKNSRTARLCGRWASHTAAIVRLGRGAGRER